MQKLAIMKMNRVTTIILAMLMLLGGVKAESGGWTERIRNSNGAMNWVEYEKVASTVGSDKNTRDYLIGPTYADYHAQSEAFPTLALKGDARGWEGVASQFPLSARVPEMDKYGGGWYCQAGPLLFIADVPSNAGVVQAQNGETYHYGETPYPTKPDSSAWWMKVDFTHTDWVRLTYLSPSPPPLNQPNWGAPKGPTAVAKPRGISAGMLYVAFQNGLIGTFPAAFCNYAKMFIPRIGWMDTSAFDKVPNIYPHLVLPAGKVPMALATTSAGEFVLAAVWDPINRKGQLAVIAVKGRVLASEQKAGNFDSQFQTGSYFYGLPNWPNSRELKLLGFIDLPIAAPTSLSVGTDLGWTSSSRDDNDGKGNVNKGLETQLNNQSVRDAWYNSVCPTRWPRFNVTARSGYAIVASRSENQVVFVDLQPLLAYYRTMYFTTQARYDETKNMGPAANQWPYSFDYRPEQKLVVASSLAVPAPTAVLAGLGTGMALDQAPTAEHGTAWRPSTYADGYAYVTTMDGQLLVYTVGGLNTEAAATTPVLNQTLAIGRNPTSLEQSNGGVAKNDMVVNCRGDKSVYILKPGGDLLCLLRDSRISDPVMAELSYNGRGQFYRSFVHIVDFAGKTVLTYVYGDNVYSSQHFFEFNKPITFGAASETVPGYPFAYKQEEVP